MTQMTIHIDRCEGGWIAEGNIGKGWRKIGRRVTSKGIESAVKSWVARKTDKNGSIANIKWFATPTHELEGA